MNETEALKAVLRTAWASDGRQESTAEHSWHLALLAALFSEEFQGLDMEKVLLMSLIHDLGELYDGDIPAVQNIDEQKKHDSEYCAVKKIFALLPAVQEQKLLSIWCEYNENSSEEAHLVKALDKAETILQHNKGRNPDNFDYGFNLEYGKKYFEYNDTLKILRNLLDEDTEKNML